MTAFWALPSAAQTQRDLTGRIWPNHATSTCIGQSSTPLCAAETLLACLARNDVSLCRRIGVTAPPINEQGAHQQVEYSVERTSVIRPEDITDDTRDLDWYRPGYTLIELGRRVCDSGQPDCRDESWEELQIYLRPAPGTAGFEIVSWRGEIEQDAAPEIPDNFLRPETNQ